MPPTFPTSFLFQTTRLSFLSHKLLHTSRIQHKQEISSIKATCEALFTEPRLREGDNHLPYRQPKLSLKRPRKRERSKDQGWVIKDKMATRSWASIAGGGTQKKENSGFAQDNHQQAPKSQQLPSAPTFRPADQSPHPEPQKSSRHEAYTASEYQRPADQTPRTSNSTDEKHYVLTLATDQVLHTALTRLRSAHFPKDLNKLAAHIAMFRALPGSQMSNIDTMLVSVSKETAPFKISVAGKPFQLRMGVAVDMKEGKDEARALYMRLKHEWNDFLSQQDKSFKPHYTIQNKEEDGEKIRQCMEDVERELTKQLEGRALGLNLWLYVKGYWKFSKRYPFRLNDGLKGGNGAAVVEDGEQDVPHDN